MCAVNQLEWNFAEFQRDAVCNGELCPHCLRDDSIECVGSAPDLVNMNYAYNCTHCGSKWEGY